MARITEIADNIYQVHPELNFMFCLSYLVLGDRPALIDPGSTTQTHIIMHTLQEELKFDLSTISYIIPTHLHIDHGGGAGYLARQLPQARVMVYERHTQYAIDPTRLTEGNKKTFGENFADKFGPIDPVPERQILPVKGGEKFDLGGRRLEVIYSRGHANHHFCLLDDRTHGLFCGDAIGMFFPSAEGVVIICPEGFDLELSLQTIDYLRALKPKVLYYAHEGTGYDTDSLMQQAAQELKDSGDIALKALRLNETSKSIEERLKNYFTANVSTKLNYDRMYLDLTVAGYRRYFQKSGILADGGRN